MWPFPSKTAIIASDNTSLSASVNHENVKCDVASPPGTSEKERTDCILRKSQRGIFKLSHQTQTQETRTHKKGEPGGEVQVCLFTGHGPPSFWVVSHFLIFLLCWSQFPRAAIRHTSGEQTTQEPYIQSSLPSGQHPEGQTRAEAERWVRRNPWETLQLFARVVSDMSDLTVDGKLEDGRPSLFVKLLSSSSVPELGHSSGSEGEKEFASPEWDVPLSKNSLRKTRAKVTWFSPSHHWECFAEVCFLFLLTEADSLQQISLQTLNADPFLKRSVTAGTCSPPPTSPTLLSRGTYSSVLNYNRYQPPPSSPVWFPHIRNESQANLHLLKCHIWIPSLMMQRYYF